MLDRRYAFLFLFGYTFIVIHLFYENNEFFNQSFTSLLQMWSNCLPDCWFSIVFYSRLAASIYSSAWNLYEWSVNFMRIVWVFESTRLQKMTFRGYQWWVDSKFFTHKLSPTKWKNPLLQSHSRFIISHLHVTRIWWNRLLWVIEEWGTEMVKLRDN